MKSTTILAKQDKAPRKTYQGRRNRRGGSRQKHPRSGSPGEGAPRKEDQNGTGNQRPAQIDLRAALTIRPACTLSAQKELKRVLPYINFTFTGTEPPYQHLILGTIRTQAERLAVAKLRGKFNKRSRLLDVGLSTRLAHRPDVHGCENAWVGAPHEKPRAYSMGRIEKLRTDPRYRSRRTTAQSSAKHWTWCTHSAIRCDCHDYGAALFVHSIYYNTPGEVVQILLRTRNRIGASVHHQFPEPFGSFMVYDGKPEATYRRAKGHIVMNVRCNESYHHPNIDWLQNPSCALLVPFQDTVYTLVWERFEVDVDSVVVGAVLRLLQHNCHIPKPLTPLPEKQKGDPDRLLLGNFPVSEVTWVGPTWSLVTNKESEFRVPKVLLNEGLRYMMGKTVDPETYKDLMVFLRSQAKPHMYKELEDAGISSSDLVQSIPLVAEHILTQMVNLSEPIREDQTAQRYERFEHYNRLVTRQYRAPSRWIRWLLLLGWVGLIPLFLMEFLLPTVITNLLLKIAIYFLGVGFNIALVIALTKIPMVGSWFLLMIFLSRKIYSEPVVLQLNTISLSPAYPYILVGLGVLYLGRPELRRLSPCKRCFCLLYWLFVIFFGAVLQLNPLSWALMLLGPLGMIYRAQLPVAAPPAPVLVPILLPLQLVAGYQPRDVGVPIVGITLLLLLVSLFLWLMRKKKRSTWEDFKRNVEILDQSIVCNSSIPIGAGLVCHEATLDFRNYPQDPMAKLSITGIIQKRKPLLGARPIGVVFSNSVPLVCSSSSHNLLCGVVTRSVLDVPKGIKENWAKVEALSPSFSTLYNSNNFPASRKPDRYFYKYPLKKKGVVSFDEYANRFPKAKNRKVRAAYAKLKAGYYEQRHFVYSIFIKREKENKITYLPMTKDVKPRVILACSQAEKAAVGPWFLTYSLALKHDWGPDNWIFYCSGHNSDVISAWFNHHLFRLGGEGNVVLVGTDFSKYDLTQGKFAMRKESKELRKLGITKHPYGVHVLKSKRLTIGYGKGVKFSVPWHRRSGEPNTSGGNSKLTGDTMAAFLVLHGANALMAALAVMGDDNFLIILREWFNTKFKSFQDFETKLKDYYLGLGMTVKVVTSVSVIEAEFLSSRFYPVGSKFVVGRKPGRTLTKIGWFMHRGGVPHEHYLEFLHGTLVSLMGQTWHVPFLRVYVRLLLKHLKEEGIRVRFSLDTQLMIESGEVHETQSNTWVAFEQFYGLTRAQEQIFEDTLEAAISKYGIPCVIHCPYIGQMITRDQQI